MGQQFRIESDSMGEMRIPKAAYYAAQTARAVENFPISPLRFPPVFIQSLGRIKKHAALANHTLGLLSPEISHAIQQASEEVIASKFDTEFVVDVFQTGSGTSTNMNANEVIATRAMELLSETSRGNRIHPNDHVNLGQSSNDVIPSAIHLAALQLMESKLRPGLTELFLQLHKKADEFHHILKIGRTHYQDATPMRLGQEFRGFASQVEHGLERLDAAQNRLYELALGGTAVGTGINTHPKFARMVINGLAEETNLPLREARNHFEAQSARDACVEASGALKTVAVSLLKMANDIRFLASGPRTGIGELKLPITQPGSSIMPGKTNPVMCEMMIQVSAQVIGNDAAITVGGLLGHLQLNTMMPVIAHNLLQSIELLANAAQNFASRCIADIAADVEKCQASLEKSLALCTALVPAIGYDQAAVIAKQAFVGNRSIRETAYEISGLDRDTVDQLLDPKNQLGSQ